jgi:hypothetical protein
MIKVQNTEYDQAGKYLRFDTYYFPSVYGLGSGDGGNLVNSAWHKTNLVLDDRKQRFIKGLTEWADQNSILLARFFNNPNIPVEQINLYGTN